MRTESLADRAAALLLVAFLVLPALWFLAAAGSATDGAGAPTASPAPAAVAASPAATHRVAAGDTIWDLAGAWTDGSAARRACIAALVAENPAHDLTGRGARRLAIGAELRVPGACRASDQD